MELMYHVLSQYYYDRSNIKDHILVINYSGVDTEYIEEGVYRLFEVF